MNAGSSRGRPGVRNERRQFASSRSGNQQQQNSFQYHPGHQPHGMRAERPLRSEVIRQTPASPQAERLLSVIGESVNRLEQSMKVVSCCEDLFKLEFVTIRYRLRLQCEQAILLSPPKWARSAEDTLWKKTFYDVISHCKNKPMAAPLLGAYRTHLTAAAGYYQQLLVKLQHKFCLTQLCGLVDWLPTAGELQRAIQGEESRGAQDEGVTRWALSAVHRCLIYLGDIARYQVDFMSGAETIARRYYHQAICLDPSHGMPQNQLATIAIKKEDFCSAAFHYVMGLACGMPFAGTENNLASLYQKVAVVSKETSEVMASGVVESRALGCIERRFVCRFLGIQQMLSQPTSTVAAAELNYLMKQTLEDFEEWLRLLSCQAATAHDPLAHDSTGPTNGAISEPFSDLKGSSSDSSVAPSSGEGMAGSTGLSVRVVAMSILLAHRLRMDGSSYTRQMTSFTLAVVTHLLDFCTDALKTSPLLSMSNPTTRATAASFSTSESNSLDMSSADTPGATGAFPSFFSRTPPSSTSHPGTTDGFAAAPGTTASPLPFGASLMSLDAAISEAVCHALDARHVTPIDASALHRGSVAAGGGGSHQRSRRRSRRRQLRRRRQQLLRADDDKSDSSSCCSDEDGDASFSDGDDEGVGGGGGGGADRPFVNGFAEDSDVEYAGSGSEADGDDDESESELVPSQRVSVGGGGGSHGDVDDRHGSVGSRQLRPIGDEKKSSMVDTDAASSLAPSEGEVSQTSIVRVAEGLPLLMAVHVAFDWLRVNPIYVATFAKNEDKLWNAVASLLNFLPRQEQLESAAANLGVSGVHELYASRHPLPEDVTLLGFSPLAGIHERYDFDWSSCSGRLTPTMETVLRLHRLEEFGQAMAETKVLHSLQWSADEMSFLGPDELAASRHDELEQLKADEEAEATQKREKLMKAMAKQKLQADVQHLEGSLKKRPQSAKPLSPYLVVDTEALLLHLNQIESLAKSHRFVIIVPMKVIDTLDELKVLPNHQPARDAIKRLEEYFRRGSRWLRAQRENEAHAPPATRKPPTDVDELRAWRFSRVIDCCVYFIQHANTKSKTSMFRTLSHSLVTLLTGQAILQPRDAALASLDTPLEKAVAEARSAGTDVYRVPLFFNMWSQQQQSTPVLSSSQQQHQNHARRHSDRGGARGASRASRSSAGHEPGTSKPSHSNHGGHRSQRASASEAAATGTTSSRGASAASSHHRGRSSGLPDGRGRRGARNGYG